MVKNIDTNQYDLIDIDIDNKFIKDFVGIESNNRLLINELIRIMKDNGYHSSFIFLGYKSLAKFYCYDDLKIIAKIFNYNKNWIYFKYNELHNTIMWKC